MLNVQSDINDIAFDGASASNERYNTPSFADTLSKRVISILSLSQPNIPAATLSLNEQSISETGILA